MESAKYFIQLIIAVLLMAASTAVLAKFSSEFQRKHPKFKPTLKKHLSRIKKNISDYPHKKCRAVANIVLTGDVAQNLNIPRQELNASIENSNLPKRGKKAVKKLWKMVYQENPQADPYKVFDRTYQACVRNRQQRK